MTIFQKMLAVPVLALFLYSGFLFYSYHTYQQSTDNVKNIRDQYLPLLEVVNDNNYLFNQIRSSFKDAVVAGEPAWLPNSEQYKQAIDRNLSTLALQPDLVPATSLSLLRESFEKYYVNAHKLAKSVLTNQDNLIVEETLVHNVEQYHNAANEQFIALKNNINQNFRTTLDETNAVMNQLLLIGGFMSIAIMLFILGVTLAVSLSTRKNVYQVIDRMRSFALGSTDFSRRLQRNNRDELSYLIYWFNRLSDKLEQDYKLLETVSITDKLTQLNNRSRTDSFLPKALAQAKDNAQTLAVIMLDIDHFKSINDTHGHLVGDEVLQAFANILKQQAREHDFIARWGGEEFILILPNENKASAIAFAEHLRLQVINSTFPTIGQLTASIGVAISAPNDSITSIVKRADDSLYQAKENGRNQVICRD